ncbi:MAG: response regulator transcription factor, partial [Actinobacteria bacterium]|nr:response regulator transcription factor [Actinomycetota bacterium]
PCGCGEGGTGAAPGGAPREEQTMQTHKLLLADSDRELRSELASELRADGYTVVCSPSERALASAVRVECPELVIVGDFDGPGAAARLIAAMRSGEPCEARYSGPVIALAADGRELCLLRCFEAGADEFLAKPASYLELRARLRAVLLRSAGDRRPRRLRIGELSIDLDKYEAAWAERPLALSPLEFSLLAELAQNPERLRTKDELLQEVWGYASIGRTRTVDAHAHRLRRKLEGVGASGYIVNRRGLGYRLTDDRDGSETA